MSDEAKIITMDIRGQICPSCLLLALKEVNANISGIRKGQVVICVQTDDRHATITIPEAVEKMGLSTRLNKDKNGYEIHILKNK